MFLFALVILLQTFQPRFVEQSTLSHNSDSLITKNWKVNDGLPVNTINSVQQDGKGYLWFTTYDGIVRFNGLEFHTFNHANTPELPQNRAVFSHFQKGVGIWVTLENGGVMLIDESYNFTHFDEEDGFTSQNTTHLMEDSKGRMWFGTFDGLYAYKNGSFERKINRDTPDQNRISYTYEDFDGTIWVATHDGLVHIAENGAQKEYNVAPGSSRNMFRRVLRLHSGELVASAMEGLYVVEDGKIFAPKKFNPILNTSVAYLYQDKDITLISTDIGLYKYTHELTLIKKHERSNTYTWYFYRDSRNTLWLISTHGKLSQYKDDKLIPSEEIDAELSEKYYYNYLIEDREGNIWLPTARNGLLQLTHTQIHTIGKEQGLSGNNILGLFEDSRGRFWVGTRDFGLNVIDGNKITIYREADIQHRDIVHSINEDAYGNVWVGYYQGGLDRFSDSEIMPYNLGFGAGINDVRAIYTASDSTIWAGTYGGLVKVDPINEQHVIYTKKDGLAGNLIRYIDEDANGGLWIGTMDGGVSHFKNNTFTNYTTSNGLASDNIRSVFVDNNEAEPTIWVGTEDNGLSRIRNSQIKSISIQQGLPDHVIHYISQDEFGWLWMSSNRGIIKINTASLNAYLDGESDYYNLIHFGREEGMRNPEANGAFQKGGLKTGNNTYWFATQEGVSVFDVNRKSTNQIPPTLIFNNITANGKTYQSRDITLDAGTKSFSAQFHALSFVSPQKTRFRYRLLGFDDEWYEGLNERTATFANIAPGKYTFQFTAANNDGIWNKHPVSVSISVPKLFYQRAWFYLLVFGVIITGYYAFSQIRYRYLMRRQQKLEEIIEEQTAQLRKEKNEIEEQSIFIRQQAKELEESNRTKDKFFSLIAHDLRNPFQVVLGYSELLLDDIETTDTETLRESITQIQYSAKSLLELLESLLEWALLHTGKMEPAPVSLYISEVITHIVELFTPVADQKNIKLNSQIEHKMPAYADRDMLKTIIRNLVSNALKFTPRGGSVSLKAYKADESYFIEVKDTGIGMSQKQIEQLLLLDKSTTQPGTDNERGSGLGLLICKEMIDLHHGEISINSEPGKGSVFTVKIPAKSLNNTL